MGGSRINGQLIVLLGFLLLCLVATFILTALLPKLVPRENHCADHLVAQHEGLLEVRRALGGTLRVQLNTGNTAKKPGKYFYCSARDDFVKVPSANVTCKEYEWRLNQFVPSVTDCVSLAGQSWFGGSSLWRQEWPLGKTEMNQSAFVPGDIYQRQYGSVMERYWISSGGFSVFVSDRVPLYVELKNEQLCLTGSLESGVYNQSARNQSSDSLLAYTICSGPDIRSLYQATKFWESPTQQPDRDLFTRPIWSTWAYLKSNISQESVLQYAKNISANNFTASQLEIDDKWSTNYGDHAFDATRFPDPRGLIEAVHSLGYNVTLWAHPFANRDSEAFVAGLEATRRGQSFLVTAGDNASEPALVGWWRGPPGTAALIDVTDAGGAGIRHLETRLQSLRSNFSVDSFKLDAGEVNWLPADARLRGYPQEPNPGWYGHAWAQLGARLDPDRRRLEVRVGFRSQQLPVLVRAMDKDSHWGIDNGLRAMVTSALTHCLIGYSFHLPDMVGGNAYCPGPEGLDGRCYPERELYIRWLQAAVFMPAVQLSVPPWEYDQEVVQIAQRLLAIRSEERFVRNMDAGLAAVARGEPLVRPMWWQDDGPVDSDDQFMLGSSVLVAPVLEKGAEKRNVTFPRGTWRHWFNETRDVNGPSVVEVEIPHNSVGAFWLV